MNSSVFMPMLMNVMTNSPPSKSMKLTNQEVTTSFQSIIDGIKGELLSKDSQKMTSLFNNQVLEDLEEKLIELFKELDLDGTIDFPLNDIQLSVELEEIFSQTEEIATNQLDKIANNLVELDLINHSDEMYEFIVLYMLQQINGAVELPEVDHPTTMQSQANILSELLITYLLSSQSEVQKDQITQNQSKVQRDQIIQNQIMKQQPISQNQINYVLNELRQLINQNSQVSSSINWEQMIKQISKQLETANQLSQSNVKQFIQKIVNETVGNQNHSMAIQPVTIHKQVHIPINFSSPMTQVEQYVIHVNQSTPTTSPSNSSQQIIEQLQNIIQSTRFGRIGGTNQLTIQLKPEHLGDMTLRFIQQDGQLTVRMIVSTQAAKEMLETNIHQLRHLFSPSQVVIERQSSEGQFDQLNQQAERENNNHQDDAQQHQQSKHDKQEEKQTTSFRDYLFHEEV
ncbi:flagellar hook-length control protein FliK [Bacillaceae bacterium W0354]